MQNFLMKNRVSLILLWVTGACFFGLTFGLDLVDPFNAAWLLSGDSAVHFFGFN